jgi:hypothetical protein
MLNKATTFKLAPDLTIYLNWSASTAAFVQEWQHRLQLAEAQGGQVEEHLAEAASMVLSTVEQLHNYSAQVLADLYRVSGQLPALGDKLLIGPLELRIEERQFEVSHSGGIEQVAITYCFSIERYRYEAAQHVPLAAAGFSLTSQLV